MSRNKPTVAMKSAAKRGVELINSGAFPVTARAEEVGKKIVSGQDLDENHLIDMAHFHAAHGGNCPDGDCEDLLWGGPAGGDWARKKMMQNQRTGLAEENIDFNKIISDKDLNLSLEIYSDIQLDEPTEETDDGLIWAPIARSGMLATRPGPNGEKLDKPLVFVPGHSENQRKEIGLQDVYDSFKEGAIEHVTVPIDMRISGEDIPAHNNKTYQNTGLIRDLKIVDSKEVPGEKVLIAAHDFTEPDIKGKAERGTIPSRSCGLLYDYKNTTTGKVYPIALDHVALTHKPWMGGMTPYGSEELSEDRTIIPMMLSEKPFAAKIPERILPTKLAQENTISHQEFKKGEIQSEFLADIVWGEKPSFRNIEKQVHEILDNMSGGEIDDYPQYNLLDVTDDKVLIKVNYGIGPDEDAWVAPYDLDKNGDLHLAPFNEWIDSTKKWVTDTIDPEKDKTELDRLGMNEKDKLIASLYLDVSQSERDKAKSNNNSLPDGSYPINNVKQLHSAAVLAASKHGDYEAAKKLIRRRAKELGVDVTTLNGFGKKKESTDMADPLKVASANRLGLAERNQQPPGGSMTLLAMSEEQMELLGLSDEAKEFQRRQNKEIEKISIELAESKKVEKETKTANKIAQYKEEGFASLPGLLREFEATALSDDGDIAVKLCLSENGHETTKVETATQIAERFMSAIPRKDSKIDFSEIPNKLETPDLDRPSLKPEDPNPENKEIKTGDELLARMLSEDPNLARDPEFLALSENGKGK